MTGLKRKLCDAVPCPPSPFFRPTVQPGHPDPGFFAPPGLQRQKRKDGGEEEKPQATKDPLLEGLKTVGGELAGHEPFKQWYAPKLEWLKAALWGPASAADKAALLGFLGLNLGTAVSALALNPELRAMLSGVDTGQPLSWIPYSPLAGLTYKLPEPGRPRNEYAARLTLDPYLAALRQRHPSFPLSGASFRLVATQDPRSHRMVPTDGGVGLEFFGGGLKAQGKTFNELSPYPLQLPGAQPGAAGSWLMQEVPGLPQIRQPGYQFTVNADLLKLFPPLRRAF